MNFLNKNKVQQPTPEEEAIFALAPASVGTVEWEVNQSAEALYKRISEIFKLYSSGEYSKALAVQRLLDLLYDINESTSGIYTKSAKSRYYLLIFTYIYRIRSSRLLLSQIINRKLSLTDQRMYIGGIDFSELNLPGLRITNALFEDCNFSKANLQELSAAGCHFERCQLDGANLKKVAVADSVFEGVTFTGSNCSSSRIVKSSFVGCDFSELISSRGQFPLRINGCEMLACSFCEADLHGADFRNTKMTGCDTLDAKKKDAKGLL
jgi:uncharacterized protein YjbI with pentapeptide repeats